MHIQLARNQEPEETVSIVPSFRIEKEVEKIVRKGLHDLSNLLKGRLA